jgi:hypothetical protein
MEFFKNLLRNILILVVIGVVIYLMYPAIMGQVFQFYWMLFGPLAIVMLIVFALPRRSRKSK